MASVGQHQPQNHNNHHSGGSRNIDGNNQDNNFSESSSISAEQDSKISSSNHLNNPLRNLNHNQSSASSASDVGTASGPRVFLCGTTTPTMDNGLDEDAIDDSVVSVVEGSNENRCQPDSDHNNVTSVALNSAGLGPGPGPSVSPGSRSENGQNSTSDYSISSSTNPSFSVGGTGAVIGESSDLETSEESSTNYRTPCVPEDDAGSSSHSEVRSSSPGLADADADVEDSPSGSEETGSESERGGNSASVMYAPNTVGFPPSRSSLTHSMPSGACFANTSKFSSGSNPFAVKGLSAGNISSSSGGSSLMNMERCSSSSSGSQNINPTGNHLPRTSPIVAGRWGTIQQQKPPGNSWNSRPIIRPSALGSSLGGGGVTSSTSSSGSHSVVSNSGSHSHHHPNYFTMNEMDSDSTGGVASSDTTTASTSSSFVLRPPKLPNPFTQGESNMVCNEPSVSGGELPSSTIAATVATTASVSSQGQPQLTKEEESSNLVFVPLAKEDSSNTDTVSTSSSAAVSGGQTAATNLFSSLNGSPSGISSFANNNAGTAANAPSSSFKLVTGSQESSSTPSSAGFVFGSNLQQRVSDSSVPSTTDDQGELPSTNGISSSSPPSTSGGLFFAALRNVQGNAVLSSSATSSQEMRSTMSGAGTSAFADMSESHADRKRRFDDAPVITGEEDEFNVIQIICRLFAFDSVTSSWLERGRGQLRLNDRNEVNNELRSRLIVRTKGSLRLMLNTNVWAGMKVDRASNKSVRFTANDNGNIKLFLVMATVGEADQLFQALDWRVKTLKTLEDKQSSATSAGGSNTSAIEDSTSSSRMARRMSESHHLVLDSSHSDQGSKSLLASTGALQPDIRSSDEDDDDFLVDEDDDDDNEELNESPSTKKKRLSNCPDPSIDGQGAVGSGEGSSLTTPNDATFSSSTNTRQTPTIRINNHEMKDLDEGGDLLD